MKMKLMFALFYLSTLAHTLFAQNDKVYDLRRADYQLQAPYEIPNSKEALYTRTANYEISRNRTVLGIVWHDTQEHAEAYFSLIERTGPGTVNKVHDVSVEIDPGYFVKNADIVFTSSGIGGINRNIELADQRGTLARIVYQRRLTPDDPWEICVKNYRLNPNGFGTNGANSFPYLEPVGSNPIVLGQGKHPAIDAFIDLEDRTAYPFSFVDFFSGQNYFNNIVVIGWSDETGYHIKVFQNFVSSMQGGFVIIPYVNNIAQSYHIPFNFEPDYCYSNTVHQMDIATTSLVQYQSSIIGYPVYQADDAARSRIYAILTDENYHLNLFEASIYYSNTQLYTSYTDSINGTYGLTNLNDYGMDRTFSPRVRIGAMKIQDIHSEYNHYLAAFDADGGGMYLATKNKNGMEIFSAADAVNYDTSMIRSYATTFNPISIASGLGAIGSDLYYANRHYNIYRESRLNNTASDNASYIYGFNYYYDPDHHFSNYGYYYNHFLTPSYLRRRYKYPYRLIASPYTNNNHNNVYNEGLQTDVNDNLSNSVSPNSGRFNVYTRVQLDNIYNGIVYNVTEELSDPVLQNLGGWPRSGQASLSHHARPTIYPNPARDYIFVEAGNSFIHAYTLTDFTGRIVKKENITPLAKQCRIELSGLPEGNYLLQLQQQDGSIVAERIGRHK